MLSVFLTHLSRQFLELHTAKNEEEQLDKKKEGEWKEERVRGGKGERYKSKCKTFRLLPYLHIQWFLTYVRKALSDSLLVQLAFKSEIFM